MTLRTLAACFTLCVPLLLILPPAPSSTAVAGTVEPAFEARLRTMPEEEKVSIMIYLADRVPIAALDAELRIGKATRAVRHAAVISALKEKAILTQAGLLAELEARRTAGEVEAYASYWIANLVVAKLTPRAALAVAARPDVAIVEPEVTAELIADGRSGSSPRLVGVPPGLRAINADRVWYELGITGEGRLVANIDTGVMGGHVALASRWRGAQPGIPWQWAWFDPYGSQFPLDGSGHGTAVMGVMAGLGAATADTIGVAWGAQWIASNALGAGEGMIAGFQWMADPDGNPNTTDDVPDALQNSWAWSGDCATLFFDVIDACEAAGCAVTFSAGNGGPGPQTIVSPANRISTPTNAFAVGAVNATDYGFPYPIANWSSRGPSICDHETKKPEVVAPGQSIYSASNNGGYLGGWWGTSFSGPHVAGIFALLREANPDLDVRTMKQLVMYTARDLEATGEDNAAGWGVVDAYAAVTTALSGGRLEGQVTSATTGLPIPGATVTIRGRDFPLLADASGNYAAILPPQTLSLEATHPAFLPGTRSGVEILSGQATVIDWVLTLVPDSSPPQIAQTSIAEVPCLHATVNTGPYAITADVIDNQCVLTVDLFYRVDGGAYVEIPMSSPVSPRFCATIPAQAEGSLVEWYVRARDWQLNEATAPSGAPGVPYSFLIDTPVVVFSDDVESNHGFTLGVPGDTATRGRWERGDPYGTYYLGLPGYPCQPEDDHTAAPGVQCFVTEIGNPGDAYTVNDVDGGCTTLLSPVFDLAGAQEAHLTYWRWWFSSSDSIRTEASSDGGASWRLLESGTSMENSWRQVSIPLRCYIDLTSQVRFRFRACDLNDDSTIEAAVDDIVISRFDRGSAGIAAGPAAGAGQLRLSAVRPNPFIPAALVSYEVPQRERVSVGIYDVTGRLVRTLVDGVVDAGTQQVVFDGRGESGQNLASGTYFLRIEAGGRSAVQKLSLVR